jgi:hypothetical protein
MSILNDRLQNASWQLKVLRGLSNIADNIVAADNDYEAKTVNVTLCSNSSLNGLYLEIRIFDSVTGIFAPPVYYRSGSNTAVLLPSPCEIKYLSDAAVLALILSELESIDTNTKSNANKTPSLNRETSNGTITAGAFSVTFANVGTTDAGIGGDNAGPPVVLGTALAAGETVTFSGSGKDTLAAIDYQASATAILLIAEVR